jgi:hypothetical protein
LKTVIDYIEGTNPPQVRLLLMSAHLFLLEILPPFATAAIKWNLPFYRLHRNFCYLNRHRDHITLGFSYGWQLAEIPGVLLGENEKLKQIRYIEIRLLEDLCSKITQQILQEAIILDETMAKPRKNRYR